MGLSQVSGETGINRGRPDRTARQDGGQRNSLAVEMQEKLNKIVDFYPSVSKLYQRLKNDFGTHLLSLARFFSLLRISHKSSGSE